MVARVLLSIGIDPDLKSQTFDLAHGVLAGREISLILAQW
jgi:hypothetical protein